MAIETLFRKLKPLDHPTTRYPGFKPGQRILKSGTVIQPGKLALPCDILLDQDVPVTLRDGTIIYTDIFRPVGINDLPAVVAWSSYGKQEGTSLLDDIPGRQGVPLSATSGLEKWEGPDPAYWCAHGYAVINPDARGAYMSEGDLYCWGAQEGQDGYDLIEWAAEQNWCNGKVGLAGNSWLAIAQWFIAAEQPPHLAAIAPWEGFSDYYQESSFRGGIPDFAFFNKILSEFSGNGNVEDVVAMAEKYPLMNEYWQDKSAKLENVTIPAYVVASWTNGAHVPGTFGAYQRLASSEKWLRIHLSHEWPDFYSHQDDLRLFFDHYLKGKKNEWEKTPPVKVSVYDPGGEDVIDRSEDVFPLQQTQYEKLYLDAGMMKLGNTLPAETSACSYNTDKEGQAVFTYTCTEDTELLGYLKLHLWVEARESTDMDLFVVVQKLDSDGSLMVPKSYEPGFSGPHGRLRVSHRALDARRSIESQPVQSHFAEALLSPGEVVPVEISISPIGMRWHAGQQLRLIIAGHNPSMLGFDWAVQPPTRNKGEHILHTGDGFDSYLLIPVIPVS